VLRLRRSEKRPPPFEAPLRSRGKQGKQLAAAAKAGALASLASWAKPSLYIAGEFLLDGTPGGQKYLRVRKLGSEVVRS
jgi:hypothetical protein